jgi:hypothetical protein
MGSTKVILAGAAVAIACAMSNQVAAREGMAAHRTEVFWTPADSLWAEALGPTTCTAGRRVQPYSPSPRLQQATFERRGELIGEILTSADQAPAVIAQAHSCAVEADSATTTQALLTDSGRNWTTFHRALSACLVRNKTDRYVGSMTLWIDQLCSW